MLNACKPLDDALRMKNVRTCVQNSQFLSIFKFFQTNYAFFALKLVNKLVTESIRDKRYRRLVLFHKHVVFYLRVS